MIVITGFYLAICRLLICMISISSLWRCCSGCSVLTIGCVVTCRTRGCTIVSSGRICCSRCARFVSIWIVSTWFVSIWLVSTWFISIRFVGSVQLADTDMLCALWNVPFLHNFSDMPEMWTYFERAYASALTKTTFKYLEIRGYLNLICAQLARVSLDNFDKDETLEEDRKKMEARFDIESIRRRAVKSATQKNDPRITIILDTIISHLEKNYTTKELCDMAEISESTLRRLFKEQAGKTLYEFIRETKMTHAARKLLVTNEPISAIAYELGYEAPSYFTKCFKEVFGVTPQEYRRTSREA